VPTQPKSGMTRNGCACALPTPDPATAAAGSSSSAASPPAAPGWRLLPTPVAGAFNDGESVRSWLARRDRQKKLGRNGNGMGTPLTIAIALLPTPVTGTSPRGHGRRGGRPGNGHQSGKDLDAAARTLTAPGRTPGRDAVAWGEYEPAIRRWEQVLGHPAPPPAEPGPGGRPRLSAAFAEWMMGIPGLVTGVPGLPRTAVLQIIGNGVVPHQAAALRLLAEIAAVPGTPPRTGTSMRAAA
jgi:DNA (cytosine-5)-methyltransferase 1